jgi:hypothetical protein
LEPHCGEALCRLFKLDDSFVVEEKGEQEEEEKEGEERAIKLVPSPQLSSIISKSKERHNELANEAAELNKTNKRHSDDPNDSNERNYRSRNGDNNNNKDDVRSSYNYRSSYSRFVTKMITKTADILILRQPLIKHNYFSLI